MGRKEKYLIGDRFLVEWGGTEHWFVKDLKGELHEIFGVEPIQARLIEAYKGDDVYWILEDVLLESSKEGEGKVVIKGNEVVSYSVLEKDKFYIKHYGQEFSGRIEVGEGKDILIGENLEVRKEENATVKFEYRFLGDKVTPMIRVIGDTGEVVWFPEFNKVYSGKLHVEDCWGCVNVLVLKNEMLYLYLLLRNGKEFLVYESSKFKELPLPNHLPKLHTMGDTMFVYFYGKENEIVHDLRRISGFNYMYVKKDPEEDLYISFDLESWKKIGQAEKVIFKGGVLGIGEHTLDFQRYLFEDALEKFAKKQSDHQELSPSL